jgi:Glu-tRNA(Gln) amidotransferase subunit E-like FAD-binding protein
VPRSRQYPPKHLCCKQINTALHIATLLVAPHIDELIQIVNVDSVNGSVDVSGFHFNLDILNMVP